VQSQWVAVNLALGVAPANPVQASQYLNFYANLIKQTDAWLVQALDLMDEVGFCGGRRERFSGRPPSAPAP